MESESFSLGSNLHSCDLDYTGSFGRVCALHHPCLLSYILLFPFAVHEVGWRTLTDYLGESLVNSAWLASIRKPMVFLGYLRSQTFVHSKWEQLGVAKAAPPLSLFYPSLERAIQTRSCFFFTLNIIIVCIALQKKNQGSAMPGRFLTPFPTVSSVINIIPSFWETIFQYFFLKLT